MLVANNQQALCSNERERPWREAMASASLLLHVEIVVTQILGDTFLHALQS